MAGCELTEEEYDLVRAAADAAATQWERGLPSSQEPAPALSGGTSASSTSALLQELGRQLLQNAADGEVQQLQTLMTRGAPITSDWLGTSPLHMAAMYGHREVAEVLLAAGIVRDVRTKVDKTPLHFAASEGYSEIVELLLANGASVDLKDMLNMTALHWAVERRHTDSIEWLLRYGADVECRNKFDKSPFDIAAESHHVGILEMLGNCEIYRADIVNTRQSERNAEAVNSILPELASEGRSISAPAANVTAKLPPTASAAAKLASIAAKLPAAAGVVSKLPPTGNSNSSTVGSAAANSAEDVGSALSSLTTLAEAACTVRPAGSSPALQLLASHGITMLPVDDSPVVPSALSIGKSISLTAAGALALGQPKPPGSEAAHSIGPSPAAASAVVAGIVAKPAAAAGRKITKVIRLTPQQFAKLTNKSAAAASGTSPVRSKLASSSTDGQLQQSVAASKSSPPAAAAADDPQLPPLKKLKFVPYQQNGEPELAGAASSTTAISAGSGGEASEPTGDVDSEQPGAAGGLVSGATLSSVSTVSSTTPEDAAAADHQLDDRGLRLKLQEARKLVSLHRQLADQHQEDVLRFAKLLAARNAPQPPVVESSPPLSDRQ